MVRRNRAGHLADIAQAQNRGARLQADALCARAIPYVEAQGLQALRDYATFLDMQKSGSGDAMRSKADRLAQTKAAHANGGQARSVYLGFTPADELDAFAAGLRQAQAKDWLIKYRFCRSGGDVDRLNAVS